MLQKELMLMKQVCQKNVCVVIIGTLKMLDLNLKSMFVKDVIIYWQRCMGYKTQQN